MRRRSRRARWAHPVRFMRPPATDVRSHVMPGSEGCRRAVQHKAAFWGARTGCRTAVFEGARRSRHRSVLASCRCFGRVSFAERTRCKLPLSRLLPATRATDMNGRFSTHSSRRSETRLASRATGGGSHGTPGILQDRSWRCRRPCGVRRGCAGRAVDAAAPERGYEAAARSRAARRDVEGRGRQLAGARGALGPSPRLGPSSLGLAPSALGLAPPLLAPPPLVWLAPPPLASPLLASSPLLRVRSRSRNGIATC